MRIVESTARAAYVHVFAACLLSCVGCATAPPVADGDAERKMLALLMPSRIEIVEPFTRAKSFDADATPDGIELLIQAVNSLNDPGLMIVGNVRVDLYEHLTASGHNEGRRLEFWDIDLSTAQNQKRYWNQVTQMYEFKLGINPTKIPLADKYVLVVSYRSPLGEQFRDECLVSYRLPTGPLGAALPG